MKAHSTHRFPFMVFLYLSFLLASGYKACTQDVIIKRDGSEIQSKVIEVGSSEIKYYKTGTTSPVYVLLKSEIFMIRYENGTKDVFENTKPVTQPSLLTTTASTPQPSRSNPDARKNAGLSRRKPGAAFLYSLLIPGAGQFYARKPGKGWIMAGTFTASTILFLAGGTYDDYTYSSYWNGRYYSTNYTYEGTYWNTEKTVGFAVMLVVRAWSMIDAPISAGRTNRKLGLADFRLKPDAAFAYMPDGSRQPIVGASLQIKRH